MSARTTISMPDELYALAVQRQKELGYSTFSDYVQALVRADGMTAGPHLRETSSGSGAAAAIVGAAIAEAKQARPPGRKVTYKIPRRTKKPTPPKASST